MERAYESPRRHAGIGNGQPSDAGLGVVVDEPMAAAIELQSAATDIGAFDTPAKKWMVGTLANGQTGTLTVLAKVVSVGPISNTVTASGTDLLGAQTPSRRTQRWRPV